MSLKNNLTKDLIEKYFSYISILARRYDLILDEEEIEDLETNHDYYVYIYGFLKDVLSYLDSLIKKERVYTRFLKLRDEYKEVHTIFEEFRR